MAFRVANVKSLRQTKWYSLWMVKKSKTQIYKILYSKKILSIKTNPAPEIIYFSQYKFMIISFFPPWLLQANILSKIYIFKPFWVMSIGNVALLYSFLIRTTKANRSPVVTPLKTDGKFSHIKRLIYIFSIYNIALLYNKTWAQQMLCELFINLFKCKLLNQIQCYILR